MTKLKSLATLLIAIYLLFFADHAISCSMYKVTVGDKTIVGTNFDAYYLTPRVWFENALTAGTYGAVFSGGRIDGVNGYAPQSGMNEFGLSFSRLASPTPDKNIVDMSGKKPIANPNFYLKDILHTCKTVEEVQNYINQYKHSFFSKTFLFTLRNRESIL